MRILLVEDDRSLTRGLVASLKAASMVVDAVETGEEALEYCRLYDFDMVLLDGGLPDMQGCDVVRRLRAARLATPVLMLSETASPPARTTSSPSPSTRRNWSPASRRWSAAPRGSPNPACPSAT